MNYVIINKDEAEAKNLREKKNNL